MAYEEEKRQFVEKRKQEEKKKMIIMIVAFAIGVTLFTIGTWISGAGFFIFLVLALIAIGAGFYFLKLFLDARKWRIHYEKQPPENFRPKTPEERAEQERRLKEMEESRYNAADASGALEGDAFDNFIRRHCRELGEKKYYGLTIDIYSIPDELNGYVKLDVKVRGTASYCAPLQEKYYNSADPYDDEMDRLQERWGSELGRDISYRNGLFDAWQVACHNDNARNLIEAKKAVKVYVGKYYLKQILEHANKYKGINYRGKIYHVVDVHWDILLDDPAYYTDKELKKLNEQTRH